MKKWGAIVSAWVIFALPASPNYILKSYEFTGGGVPGQSAQYKAETVIGGMKGAQKSATYNAGGGVLLMQQSDVVGVTIQNSGNWYNKLLATIQPGSSPSNTLYAIAVSTDNFVTEQYVQSDNRLGSTLTISQYRTYTGWGSSSGTSITGLIPNTTYYVRARSLRGEYTEGEWGPISSATTTTAQISFDIDVAPTDQSTSPPYTVSLGTLAAGNVITASDKIWVSVATNAEAGGTVYVSGSNTGLTSTVSSYTIPSSSQNLAAAAEGYGVRVNTTSQTAGGPLVAQAPYDNSGDIVGVVDTQYRPLFSTSVAPITGGRGSVIVKAKVPSTAPSGTDYTDTITLLAAGSF